MSKNNFQNEEKNDFNETSGKTDSKSNRNRNRRSRNKNRSNKGQSGNGRSNGKTQDFTGRPTNNASMYYTDAVFANQVSSFSFAEFLGDSSTSNLFGDTQLPTVMTLAVNPSPGLSDGSMDAGINVVGMRTYTKLSANNAKTTLYAPQDVSTMILALGEVISMIEVAKRAMRVAYTYNPRNRALPLGIIRAMGFDPQFVTDGTIATMRLKLNTVINSFNQIPVLSNIEYFRKCSEIYANYYADAEGPMTQYYVFTPYSTWVLDEKAVDTGSVLKTLPVLYGAVGHVMTMNAFLTKIQSMITEILGSATLNYIFADVLRLSSDSDLLKIPMLPEGDFQLPVYDPMKLLQIHNSVAVGAPSGATLATQVTPRNDVYPSVETNGILYLPKFSDEQYKPMGRSRYIIDFPHSMGDPDVDQRVDVTRYISIIEQGEDESTALDTSTLVDHYVVCYGLFFNDEFMFQFTNKFSVAQSGDTIGAKNVYDLIHLSGYLSKFDYHPFVLLTVAGAASPGKESLIGDVDFFTTVDVNYLKSINEMAMQGLFEVR